MSTANAGLGWVLSVAFVLALARVASAQTSVGTVTDTSYALFSQSSSLEFASSLPSGHRSEQTQDILSQWPKGTIQGKTLAPAILITLGLIAFRDEGLLSRKSIEEWRDTYLPTFSTDLDDYTAEIPALLTFGLNIAGVEGRSGFLRALAYYATAFAINFASVNTVKGLTEVRRPSGAGTKSFPSGHTSSAFMGATFLHREYGAKSPYYSIAGYGIATATGAARILNNNHWLPDVLVSAGIGILSTEIAYLLVDGVAGDWRLNPPPPAGAARGHESKPSFMSFDAGYARLLGDPVMRDDVQTVKNGWTAGLEGAYFFNRSVGIGGQISLGTFPLHTDAFVLEDPEISALARSVSAEPLASRSVFVGPYFDFPVGGRWSATASLTAGWASGAEGCVCFTVRYDLRDPVGEQKLPVLQFRGGDSFGFEGSLGLRGTISRTIGLGVFAQYNFSRPDYEVREAVGLDQANDVIWGSAQVIKDVKFDYFALGATLYGMIW